MSLGWLWGMRALFEPELCTKATLNVVRQWSSKKCRFGCWANGTSMWVNRGCKAQFQCRGRELPCYGGCGEDRCTCTCSSKPAYAPIASHRDARRLVNATLIASMLSACELSNRACTAVPGALGLTQPLFEGCDVGYLDMGTNTGTRIGALYEPQHYPKEQELFKHMDKRGFSREAVCTVAFEPNPVHHLKLRQMAQRYRALGRRVRILEAAIGGTNSVQRFYSDGDMGEKVRASYWGSSLLMWSAAHSRVADETSVLVPVVSFDWLLQALVLPSPPKKALYAKMDIEGGETAPQAMNPV